MRAVSFRAATSQVATICARQPACSRGNARHRSIVISCQSSRRYLITTSGASAHPAWPPLPPRGGVAGCRIPQRVQAAVCRGSAIENLEKVKDDGGQGSAEQYNAAVLETCSSGDWLACLELLTEARLLRVSLNAEVLEAAATALADANQGKKAADVLAKHLKAGGSVSTTALTHVMGSLARKADADTADMLIKAAAPDMKNEEYAAAFNCLTRTFARADRVDEAKAMFLDLFRLDLVHGDTYTVLASMYLRAGDGEQADTMLELRS